MNMVHRDESKYSTLFWRSAGTVLSVANDLNRLKILMADVLDWSIALLASSSLVFTAPGHPSNAQKALQPGTHPIPAQPRLQFAHNGH
jgi:hypothetical protein